VAAFTRVANGLLLERLMFKLGSMAAGFALLLATAGTLGLGGCASDYEGYGWMQPTSPEPKDTMAPAPNGKLSSQQKEKLLAAVTETVKERAFATGVDFSKWPEHLEKHQARIDAAETMTQFSTAVNRALSEFGISHIDFMSPRAAQAQHTQKFGGIGITRDTVVSEAGIKITEVRDGGPASKAGLKPGDTIVEVDGKKAEVESIKGEVGTDVTLKVLRAESGKTDVITLRRVLYDLALPPRLIRVSDEAAVVRLDSFTDGYDRNVVKKVMTEAADYPLLVVDLRYNGGGEVQNFINFLGTFLPQGTDVGTFISKEMVEKYQKERESNGEARETNPDPVKIAAWTSRKVRINKSMVDPYPGKVAVLINGSSASASEITAAALRELRDAPLVGSNSAGAVLMSRYMKMDNGFEMKVPMSDYVTIKGLRIEGSPLQPDVRVGVGRGGRGGRRAPGGQGNDYASDPVVQAAIEALRAGTGGGLNGAHAEQPVKVGEDGK
jgi:carboxyl-terminal processing protease